ncbi:MAG: DUF4345 family protein [Pseudomonadota bacterium]
MVRLFLLIQAILFAGFGIYVFIDAPALAVTLGVPDMPGSGLYEIRSNYGGVNLGIGLFCLAAVIRPALERYALVFVAVFTGSYAMGRVLSLPYEGDPTANFIAFGCYEAAMAVFATLLLRRLDKAL